MSQEIMQLAYVHVFGKPLYHNKFEVRVSPAGSPRIMHFTALNRSMEFQFELPIAVSTMLDRGFLLEKSETNGTLKVYVYSEIRSTSTGVSIRSKAYVADIDATDQIGPYLIRYSEGQVIPTEFRTLLSAKMQEIINRKIDIEKGVRAFFTSMARQIGSLVILKPVRYQIDSTSYNTQDIILHVGTRSYLEYRVGESTNAEWKDLKYEEAPPTQQESVLPIVVAVHADSINSKIRFTKTSSNSSESPVRVRAATITPQDSSFVLMVIPKSGLIQTKVYATGNLMLEFPLLRFQQLRVDQTRSVKISPANVPRVESMLRDAFEIYAGKLGLSGRQLQTDEKSTLTIRLLRGQPERVEGYTLDSRVVLLNFQPAVFSFFYINE